VTVTRVALEQDITGEEEETTMVRPARRTSNAAGSVMSTVMSVVTLPFRVLGQLFGGRRRRTARTR
jgi:hypothetical protein